MTDLQAAIDKALREMGLNDRPDLYGPDGIHEWRCQYPDRYGPCKCFSETVEHIARAVESV